MFALAFIYARICCYCFHQSCVRTGHYTLTCYQLFVNVKCVHFDRVLTPVWLFNVVNGKRHRNIRSSLRHTTPNTTWQINALN